MFGDPLQLPPVKSKMIYGTPLLRNFDWIVLKEVVRQKDLAFVNALNKVRLGVVDDEVDDLFKSRSVDEDDVVPSRDNVIIAPLKVLVDKWNDKALEAQVDEEEHVFYAEDFDELHEEISDSLKRQLFRIPSRYRDELVVKRGCRIIVRRNIDLEKGICNGTLAIVEEAHDSGFLWCRHATTGELFALGVHRQPLAVAGLGYDVYRDQIPADVAQCLTVHRVQGMTLGTVTVDMTQLIFAPGMTYVALSRAQTLEDLSIVGWNRAQVRIPDYFTELWATILELDVLNPFRRLEKSRAEWPEQPSPAELNFSPLPPFADDAEGSSNAGGGTDADGIPLDPSILRPLVCTRHSPRCKTSAACAEQQ